MDFNHLQHLPIRILERLPQAERAAESKVALIKQGQEARLNGLNDRLSELIGGHKSKRAKLAEFRNLVDEFLIETREVAACRQGCSHCCHIPVAVTRAEAELIGQEISVTPARITQTKNPQRLGHGYHMPCPFLADGKCSIYESRPIACRTHFSLDDDDLLCQLDPNMIIPVPSPDNRELQMAYLLISGSDPLADIRDFFPRSPIIARP